MAASKSLMSLLLGACLMGMISTLDASNFNVGGRLGWVETPSESYNNWSARNRFQVGDSLVFKYNKGADSVLVVSKQDYDSCNVANPTMKLDGGDSTFKLDKSGPFYFISGVSGHCGNGQKMLVVVISIRNKKLIPPPASALPPSSTAPTTSPTTTPPSPSTPSVSAPSPAPPLPSTSTPPASSPELSPVAFSPSMTPALAAPTASPVTPPSMSPTASPVTPPSMSPAASSADDSAPSPTFSPDTPPSAVPAHSPASSSSTPASAPSSPATANSSSSSSTVIMSGVLYGLVALVVGVAVLN